MKNRLLLQAIALLSANIASAAWAADIVLTPPAAGGVAITNAAGNATRFRVGDDGTIAFPALGIVPGTFTGLCLEVATGKIGTCAPVFRDPLSLNGNLVLVESTATTGNIMKGTSSFIHNYGTNSTFVGEDAGNFTLTGFSNTGIGLVALNNLTTGSRNTATGFQALVSNATGNQNTASGHSALVSNTDGTNNTAIGYLADVSTGSLTNATAIGALAIVDASNKIRLGDANVSVIEGQVAYTFTSDRNAKENVRAVDARQVLEKLRSVNVASWNYIGHDPRTARHYGPMAQDFHEAFGRDEVGTFGTDTTINSGDMTGILMIGLQGLDAQVQKDRLTMQAQAAALAQHKDRIAELDRERQALSAEIAGLKAALAEVAELKQHLARVTRRLDQQRTASVTAGLDIK